VAGEHDDRDSPRELFEPVRGDHRGDRDDAVDVEVGQRLDRAVSVALVA
jgi:hypothetical protein